MTYTPHRLNSLFSGTGTFLTLLSHLFLADWYSLASIGEAGVLLAWITMVGLIATVKLDNIAFNTADIKLSNDVLVSGLISSFVIALLTGLFIVSGYYIFSKLSDFSIQLSIVSIAIVAGIGGTKVGAVRLQKESKLVQLGVSRFTRGFVSLVALFFFSSLGSIGVLFAFGLGQLSSLLVSLIGWRFSNFQFVSLTVIRDGFSVTISSILVSLTEAVKLMILEAWLLPSSLGLLVYLSRIMKGAMTWPGQPIIDRMLSKYTETGNSVEVYLQGGGSYIWKVGLVGSIAGLLVLGYLYFGSDNPMGNPFGWWFLLVVELILTSLLVIYRRIPIMINKVVLQVQAEMIFFSISVLLFSLSCLFLKASALTLIAILVVSNLFAIGYYQWKTGYFIKGDRWGLFPKIKVI